MSYSDLFARHYDEFLTDFDYKLTVKFLLKYTDSSKPVLDIGCGTGRTGLLLAKKRCDMILADPSADMLSVARERFARAGRQALFLQQSAAELDLYGTVGTVISTLDTFNHIVDEGEFVRAIARMSLFLERGGRMIFDLNSLYKHRELLQKGEFSSESKNARAEWKSELLDNDVVRIEMKVTDKRTGAFHVEQFFERAYDLSFVREALAAAGVAVDGVFDGYSKREVREESERIVVVGVK